MHTAKRQPGSFDGVSQILLYNWHFYAAALALDLVIALLLIKLPLHANYRPALYLVAVPPTFWAGSSILVSYYVYDRSCLYQWHWLATVLKSDAGAWLNIHAGLDQTSVPLRHIFPSSHTKSLDIYAPSEMSEPSIARARRRAHLNPVQETANPAALPQSDSAWDTVFLIFTAHELRTHNAKVKLFRELHRVLKWDGRIVLVEHLRDWKNCLAYGPGCLHFFSRQQWLAVCNETNLRVLEERWITPFVKCFVFAKARDSAQSLSAASE
jgi:SAM-dependent methyltransferase